MNYLEVDVDKLFQSNNISEIDGIQRKIHYEIERKKEDLRAMVGERYRDLIQAADTIKQMKETASKTVANIDRMINECKNIHDTHLVGFKTETPQSTTSNITSIQSLSLQVKILMDLPEKIWMSLDEEDFFTATKLFILARHIYTGLLLIRDTIDSKNIMCSLKPIVTRQWNVLANFKETIENACNDKLQDVDINQETATSCLLSLYLLNGTSLVSLMNTFIRLHSNKSLETTLKFEISDALMKSSLKDEIMKRVVSCVKVVIKTVQLLQLCFVADNGGSVLNGLEEIYSKSSTPLIKLLHMQHDTAYNILPQTITNYRLSTKEVLCAVSKDEVGLCVSNWIEWVNEFIQDKVTLLLLNITNASTLYKIKDEAVRFETPKNWSQICASLSIKDTDIWSKYFQPIFTNRVKQIIDTKLNHAEDIFEKQLVNDLNSVSTESCIEKECDLNWYVWKDLIGDTVIQNKDQVVQVMNDLMKGMWLQDRGYTPTLESLCHLIDDEYSKLLKDLKPYLYDDSELSSLESEEDGDITLYTDRKEIEKYLIDAVENIIKRKIKFIKESCFKNVENLPELKRKTTAIYTARLCQALTILVPSMQACIVNVDRRVDEYHRQYDMRCKRWASLCDMLKECCLWCWQNWLDIVFAHIEGFTSYLPKSFTIEDNLQYLMMQWDTIKIEQKGENEESVETNIKIPSGPSMKLQKYIYKVARVLDQVVPHTIPKTIHTQYVERAVGISLAHYNRVIKENIADINQRCALQLLMDVRHVTLLMVSRENKKGTELSQEICEQVRGKVDPFDYDVFYPYIQTNVKRSVQRVQTIFASLITNNEQLIRTLGTKPIQSGGTSDKAPNILTPASSDSTVHWFTLLPITAPVIIQKKNDKIRKKTQVAASPSKVLKSDISELMSTSLPINLANAKSGAAAFFGSMASDWFSGS